jgi:hypothetical protein
VHTHTFTLANAYTRLHSHTLTVVCMHSHRVTHTFFLFPSSSFERALGKCTPLYTHTLAHTCLHVFTRVCTLTLATYTTHSHPYTLTRTLTHASLHSDCTGVMGVGLMGGPLAVGRDLLKPSQSAAISGEFCLKRSQTKRT